MTIDEHQEWLEADGVGGFASGTANGIRTRRYHALLLTATTPPTGRMVLVNGFDAWVTTSAGRFALTTQRYAPNVLHPDGHSRLVSFTTDPWPTWEFVLPDGGRITQEIVVQPGSTATVVAWRSTQKASLEVRLFLSGRDYHSLHHENTTFRFEPTWIGNTTVEWQPYRDVPGVRVRTNGYYKHAPEWFRNFLYIAERERGLDDVEDLASPGLLSWRLDESVTDAVLALSAISPSGVRDQHVDPVQLIGDIRTAELLRRAEFPSLLARAADAYLVRRGGGRSVIAGYPWFTDWGRDTFIAMRGLCLATGRLNDARAILLEWSSAVSDGMLPNRFVDSGETPEFNAVDASLWYVIAVHELLDRARGHEGLVSRSDRTQLHDAVREILTGYSGGTRFGIRVDDDGLLAAGERGVQVTWMDARVGDRVITPRTGKPVEVQALWLNALSRASVADPRWAPMFARGRASFNERFWNDDGGCLFDVVDVDHTPGSTDAALRPNQIFAVGGLPVPLIEGARARMIVDAVEQHLLTPVGLRTLAAGEPAYRGCYKGGPAERDACYHQGAVWPWLMGAFVEAWMRVRGGTHDARREARERFVAPLLDRAMRNGGHLFEIADGDAPFTPRGCPFQAWSLGELLRAEALTRT